MAHDKWYFTSFMDLKDVHPQLSYLLKEYLSSLPAFDYWKFKECFDSDNDGVKLQIIYQSQSNPQNSLCITALKAETTYTFESFLNISGQITSI